MPGPLQMGAHVFTTMTRPYPESSVLPAIKLPLAPVFTLILHPAALILDTANPAFSRIYYKASFRLRKTFRANTLNHLVSVQATQRSASVPFELTAEGGAFWTVK